MSDQIVITLPTGPFYGSRDKEIFFGWLYSIPGYVSCRGVGTDLFVSFDKQEVIEDTVDDLVELLRRYFPRSLPQLGHFESSPVGQWLVSPERYFHRDVFGRSL